MWIVMCVDKQYVLERDRITGSCATYWKLGGTMHIPVCASICLEIQQRMIFDSMQLYSRIVCMLHVIVTRCLVTSIVVHSMYYVCRCCSGIVWIISVWPLWTCSRVCTLHHFIYHWYTHVTHCIRSVCTPFIIPHTDIYMIYSTMLVLVMWMWMCYAFWTVNVGLFVVQFVLVDPPLAPIVDYNPLTHITHTFKHAWRYYTLVSHIHLGCQYVCVCIL